MIFGPGLPGSSGANTVITGRIRPPFVAARRWPIDSAAISAAELTRRRSGTRRLRQYRRPMQRELLRHATCAANSNSAAVCRYVPADLICSRTCLIRPPAGPADGFSAWKRAMNCSALANSAPSSAGWPGTTARGRGPGKQSAADGSGRAAGRIAVTDATWAVVSPREPRREREGNHRRESGKERLWPELTVPSASYIYGYLDIKDISVSFTL